jgi:hypothetical protein
MGIRERAVLLIVGLWSLSAAISCAPSADLPDTPELRLEKARLITQMEREGGGFEDTLDRGAAVGVESTSDALTLALERELTSEEKDHVRAVMRGALAEVLTAEAWEDALAQVYAAHFTPNELQATIDFFSSPAGRKIIEAQGMIDAETGDAVDEIIDSRLDEFIQRIDTELAAAFPELAEEGS